MAVPDIKSRIKGSIFGVAVVDALGGPVEFQPRGTFGEVTEYQFNSTFGVPSGTWTDDTSMTLCLAKALIDSKGEFIPQLAIRNYMNWSRNGYFSAVGYCFDIGGSTSRALFKWRGYFDKQPDLEKDDPRGHEGGQSAINDALNRESCCGNGSLMRVSPIGLAYFRDMDLAILNAARSSEATHPHPVCTDCCVIYTKLIVRVLNGAGKEDLAAEIASAIANSTIAEIKVRNMLRGYKSVEDWKSRHVDRIDSSGYVISTLEAALWAFFTTDTFRDGAVKVVNLGDDADTVGAVYGGLAGAYYGFEEIPASWVEGLQARKMVDEIASGLAALSE